MPATAARGTAYPLYLRQGHAPGVDHQEEWTYPSRFELKSNRHNSPEWPKRLCAAPMEVRKSSEANIVLCCCSVAPAVCNNRCIAGLRIDSQCSQCAHFVA